MGFQGVLEPFSPQLGQFGTFSVKKSKFARARHTLSILTFVLTYIMRHPTPLHKRNFATHFHSQPPVMHRRGTNQTIVGVLPRPINIVLKLGATRRTHHLHSFSFEIHCSRETH